MNVQGQGSLHLPAHFLLTYCPLPLQARSSSAAAGMAATRSLLTLPICRATTKHTQLGQGLCVACVSGASYAATT